MKLVILPTNIFKSFHLPFSPIPPTPSSLIQLLKFVKWSLHNVFGNSYRGEINAWTVLAVHVRWDVHAAAVATNKACSKRALPEWLDVGLVSETLCCLVVGFLGRSSVVPSCSVLVLWLLGIAERNVSWAPTDVTLFCGLLRLAAAQRQLQRNNVRVG